MKTVRLVIVFYFVLHTSFAQKIKSATVFNVNSTVAKVYGLQFQGNEITYRLYPSGNSRIVRRPRKEISRIRYSNGKEELITISPLPSPGFVMPSVFSNHKLVHPLTSPKADNGLRPDRIYKKDRGIIECSIVEIGLKEIKYVVITEDSKQVRIIKREQVEKVEKNLGRYYAPGQNKPPKATPKKESLPKRNSSTLQLNTTRSTKKREVPEGKTQVSTTTTKTNDSDYSYSAFTLGIMGSQILPISKSQWTDERDGLGLKISIGGSIEYTKRFNHKIGLATEFGFSSWASEYRWKNDSELLYSYSVSLSRLFVSAGPKLYIGKAFYVLPQAQIDGLQLRQTGRNGKAITLPDRTQRIIYWGGSGRLGYEVYIGSKFTVDAGIGYNYLAKPLQLLDYAYPPNKHLHFISLRVAFGLISY